MRSEHREPAGFAFGGPARAEKRGGAVDERAAAYLSRVAEPGHAGLWQLVRRLGYRDAAEAVRCGDVDADVRSATEARRESTDPDADLEAASRRGIRLLVPSSPEWPAYALGAMEARTLRSVRLEPDQAPPLALWARGSGSLSASTVRSLAVVGSRASTAYGEHIASDWCYSISGLGVTIVSGGAYGIDAAAHRGALGTDGTCVLVSARGLDEPYPSGNAQLYDRVEANGVVVSEFPPGSLPHRHRFLARNRLIAAFGSATLVVECARRSGALNTARHARELGRPVLAVPGPVTSALSAGAHLLLQREESPAVLVTSATEVAQWCGASYEASELPFDVAAGPARATDPLPAEASAVFDGVPSRGSVSETELARLSGKPIPAVLRALPALIDAGLIEPTRDGYRLRRDPRLRR